MSDDIRECTLHFPEVPDAAEQEDDCDKDAEE